MKKVGQLLILIALSGTIFAYFVVPTRMELVSTPPPEFLQARSEWDAKRSDAEMRVAHAYWDRALVTLQWKYPAGVDLPDTPPAEFQIDTQLLADAMKLAPQSRERYWKRLREAWRHGKSWHKVRVWDSSWITRHIQFWREALR